jgi:hypothetical protein
MGIATLFYIGLLIVNALAILNEQRFLARSKYHASIKSHFIYLFFILVGLTQQAVSFGEQETIRYKIIHLVSAVRTLMRGKYKY